MDTLEECRSIEASLFHISLNIETLVAEQARLRRRLNGLRANTSVLPSETLASIFEFACMEYRDKIRLGSVCSHWRSILHATPSLWTSVSLSYTLAKGVDFLLYHHQRAKNVPLDVKLYSGRHTSRERISPLLRVLLTNMSHHLHSLSFYSIDRVIWSVIESSGAMESDFPQLEDLSLNFGSGHSCELKVGETLFSSPRLSRIRLGFAMPGIEEKLSLENVTQLDATRMISSPQGMRLLALCPKIVHFSYEVDIGYEESEVGMSTSRHSVAVLPHLKTMVWSGGNSAPAAELIRLIQLPSIHQLNWKEFPPTPPSARYAECKISFFSSMSDLRILDSSLNAETTVMLSCFSSLEILDLSCSNENSLSNRFHSLIRELTWTETGRILPCLKHMVLRVRRISKSELTGIIKMLESRRSGGLLNICASLEAFILRVKSQDIVTVWEKGHVTALKHLVQEGLGLVIWEDQYAPGRMLVL